MSLAYTGYWLTRETRVPQCQLAHDTPAGRCAASGFTPPLRTYELVSGGRVIINISPEIRSNSRFRSALHANSIRTHKPNRKPITVIITRVKCVRTLHVYTARRRPRRARPSIYSNDEGHHRGRERLQADDDKSAIWPAR